MNTSLTDCLVRKDLADVLDFCDGCLTCSCDDELHESVLRFAKVLGFEFVLYAYQKHAYNTEGTVEFVNLSNPKEWMEEYHENNYLLHDPIRIELEARLREEPIRCSIHWDAYQRQLSRGEVEVIKRRRSFGLRYGFSVFDNSRSQNSIFLISFSSKDQEVDERCQAMGCLIVPHLNRCRKRLNLLMLVDQLTARERAVARWLAEGKTNWEIATILKVSSSTVKFHVANILKKLNVPNRQGAIVTLLAVRLLS